MALKVIIIIISQLRRPYQGNGTLEMCQVLHRENTDGKRSKKMATLKDHTLLFKRSRICNLFTVTL